jgi:hypothetical protein
MFDSVLYESFPTANGLPFDLNWGMLFLCMTVSLVIGIVLATVYRFSNKNVGRSFMTALILVPPALTMIIPLCNSNLGIGLAMAGVFSLVRFRSVPGTAKEIGIIFVAMGAGLICGMGYLAYAALFTVVMSLVLVIYNGLDFGTRRNAQLYKTLRITIPEDLDYTSVFDDIFETYTSECELAQVKTTNMGSLFRLTYDLTLKDPDKEKEMIDKLRVRNGNLEITVSKQVTINTEL